MYEKLLVYALLYVTGYDTMQMYRNLLDLIVVNNPEDYEIIELRYLFDKEAISHTLEIMNSIDFDKNLFGKELMVALKEIYLEQSDIKEFGNCMYKLWGHFPGKINMEEPFYTLNYADDCLSFGDEKQCRELYEKAFGFYENGE